MYGLIENDAFRSLLGGGLIGLAAAMLLVCNGRVAGVSGIASRLIDLERGDLAWRVVFLGGLLLGGVAVSALIPGVFVDSPASWEVLVGAGLAVGVGTGAANGCTSGHGVCGLARLSRRSLAATVTFMSVAFVTVFLVRHAGVFG